MLHNITPSLGLLVPNRHSLPWATKWFHLHSGDAVATSIPSCQPSPQQTLTTKVQPPAIDVVQLATSFIKHGPQTPYPESAATPKPRHLHCVLPTLCLSQYSKVEHLKSPPAESLTDHLHRFIDTRVISYSPTVKFDPNLWNQRFLKIHRLMTVENSTFSSHILRFCPAYNFGFYNLDICWIAIVYLPRQSFRHRHPRPVLLTIPHCVEAPLWFPPKCFHHPFPRFPCQSDTELTHQRLPWPLRCFSNSFPVQQGCQL